MRAVPDDEPFAPPDAALRDPERLAALGATGLSAERPSEVLDHVARVAARLLDAPVALISLVDDERQVFAGRASERGPIGTRRQTPLSHSLCQYVVADGAPVVVADAVHDRRTRDHPAVRDLEVRAYAGVPLTTADGVTLGVLCAIDDAPHAWAPDDVARLRELASVAAAELRRRIAEAALHESQERLALIFARAAVGLSEVGPDGRFLRVNDELCRIVGHTPGEMAQLTVADVTHPDDVPRSVNAVAAVLAEGGSVRLEKRYRRPDGSLVSAESVVTRLDGGAGGERTLLAVTADLTARRQAETALRESEARFRQLADNVSEMFWLLELGPTLLESRVIYMNPAYTRVTGRAREEVYAAPVLGMAHARGARGPSARARDRAGGGRRRAAHGGVPAHHRGRRGAGGAEPHVPDP
jgi:PAS domain S-box-containing protein